MAIATAIGLGSLLISVQNANANSLAQVIAEELNVREQPDTTSAIVGTIARGKVVAVLSISGEWVHIRFYPDIRNLNDIRTGWVSIRHLIPFRDVGSRNSHTTSGGATFNISVNRSDIDCNEGSEGYESCEVSVSFSYDSDYNGGRDPNPRIECKAQINTISASGLLSSSTKTETTSVYGRRGSGDIDIDFSLYGYDPIVNVSLEDVECEITDVYE